VGFGVVRKTLTSLWQRRQPFAGVALRWLTPALVLLLLPPAVGIARIHPYELSYYSEVVGGLPGATQLGLETTFWCETFHDALPYLNVNAEQGASVWVENPYVLRLYQRYDLLRSDLLITGGDTVSPYDADYAVVEMRQTGFTYTPEVVDVLGHETPLYTIARYGVPLMHIFKLHQASSLFYSRGIDST
jgi:hypothetical protein